MDRIIEKIERCQGILIPILDLLGRLLEARKHGTLSARKMLSGISVLPDLGKDLLHDHKLIWYEREIPGKVLRAGVSLDIQHRSRKAEKIPENRVILVIDFFQCRFDFRLLLQNTLLNDFICGRRGQ